MACTILGVIMGKWIVVFAEAKLKKGLADRQIKGV